MCENPVLYTNRLCLRPFSEEDAEAAFFLFGDQTTNTFLPWFPVVSLAEARDFLVQRFILPDTGYRYAVCLREKNALIGYICLSGDENRDLGYGFHHMFWNRGFATEAGAALIEQAKKDRIPYITATHDLRNLGSGRVMQKLHMTYQYSYVEHWQPKNMEVTFRMYQRNLDGQDERVYQKYWKKYPQHFIERIAEPARPV